MTVRIRRKQKRATIDVLHRKVPRNLHAHWKAWCSLRGISMRDMYIAHMKDDIQKREMK